MNVDVGVVVLGAIAALLATGAAFIYRRGRRASGRLARLKATETSRIADAAPGGVVELAGKAIATDESALVEAPLSKTRCLYWRVRIEESHGSATKRVAEATDGCDFFVDDDSGALARVMLGEATVVATRSTSFGDEEGAKRLLAKLGVDKPISKLLWYEEALREGDDVYVLGFGRATALPDGAPFRRGRERIVVVAPEGGELLVSVGDEAALAFRLSSEAREAVRLAKIFGALAALFALVAGAAFAGTMR